MADDSRTYIRLHDGMPDHPKVDALSDKAFRLLVETWCWCSRHLTDGEVPRATWTRRGTAASRRELVNAGLVDDQGDHLQMHDYLQHQRSRAEAAEAAQARRSAALKANHSRWHTGPRGKPDPDCDFCIGSEKPSDSESAADREPDSDRSPSGLPIDRGTDRGTAVVPGEISGGGVPDSTASSTPAPPNLDPDNPRCGDHADIPATERGPNCRACRAVRRQLEANPVDSDADARAAWRAEVDACDECDENGKVELPDGSVARHHQIPSDRREAS